MNNGKKRCPDCNGTQTYYRSKSGDYHCQSCGRNFKQSEVKE